MRKGRPDRPSKANVARRPRVVRATISLDGKLVSGASARGMTLPDLEEAEELLLSVKPVILGGSKAPALTGDQLQGFLPKDLRFRLLSVTSARGTLLLRYRRI